MNIEIESNTPRVRTLGALKKGTKFRFRSDYYAVYMRTDRQKFVQLSDYGEGKLYDIVCPDAQVVILTDVSETFTVREEV